MLTILTSYHNEGFNLIQLYVNRPLHTLPCYVFYLSLVFLCLFIFVLFGLKSVLFLIFNLLVTQLLGGFLSIPPWATIEVYSTFLITYNANRSILLQIFTIWGRNAVIVGFLVSIHRRQVYSRHPSLLGKLPCKSGSCKATPALAFFDFFRILI